MARATDWLRRPGSGAVDGKREESIDFRTMVHRVHASATLRTKPTIYGFGGVAKRWSAVRSPNEVVTCASCHDGSLATGHMLQMGGVFGGLTQAELDALQ